MKNYTSKVLIGFLWLACYGVICHGIAHAGIMAESTRIIFGDGARERSIRLTNTNDYPVMVQTWVDDGQGSNAPDTVVSAMFVAPSVFRLQPHEIKQVRILYTEDQLDTALEKVLWLNLYEIPILRHSDSKPDGIPRLLVGLNTQIKIFYRAPKMPAPGSGFPDSLTFRLERQGAEWLLVCHNDSPYHASFGSLLIHKAEQTFAIRSEADLMVQPQSERRYPLVTPLGFVGEGAVRLIYFVIDDDGRFLERSVELSIPTEK